MAVSMNAGGNMRADFMISDAALPLRIEEIAEEQAGMFAQLLSDIGNAKGDLAVEVEKVVQKYSDMKQAGEAVIYRDKETGMPLPEDPKKLAAMILKGKVKLKNVPAELLTPELMKFLALMKKAEEFNKDDEDDEDEDSLFDPVNAIAAEQKFRQELSNSMLMELYQIIEKHNERESEDKVTMLDGISEPIDETQTLPSVAATEQDPAMGESMFTQLIDNLVETVSEGFEAVEETAAKEAIPDVGAVAPSYVPEQAVVPHETEEEAPVLSDTVKEAAVVADTAPVINVSEVTVADDVVVSEVSGAEFEAVIPQDVAVEVNVQEQTVSEAPEADIPEEMPVTVQTVVSQDVQTAETAAYRTIPAEEFTVKTVKTEAKPEIAENAVRTDNTEEPVTVKVVTRNENAEQLDKTASEEPKTVTIVHERVKSAAEELEMLRNARAKFTAKPVEEEFDAKPAEEKTESIPFEKMPGTMYVEEKSEAKPAEEKSEANPVEEKSEAKPVERKSEAKPAEEKSEAKPVEEKSETKFVEERPEAKSVEERPEAKSVEERPEAKSVEERPEAKSVEEKPETNPVEEKSEAKPGEQKLEVKPEQTAQPLNADSPVVIKRADGSEIEVRPSEVIKQTLKLVEKAITDNDQKEAYTLELNPEELGKITVKLTKAADGAVSITIAAENARTQHILEQHSEAMQQNLRSNGLNLESWQTVNERQQETAAQDYNGSSKNPYFRNDDNETEDNPDGGSFADIIASM